MNRAIKRLRKKSPSQKVSTDTDYLLSNKANATRLLESMKQDRYREAASKRFQKIVLPKKVDRANFMLLTSHQAQIVFMICKEKTVKEIASKLNITEKTLFNTRLNIFKKLAVKSTVGLVKYVYKYGYLKF
jgi:DNA-binding NarL/FixJ family response regulator